MSLFAEDIVPVPEETARVAGAAFAKGNVYMRMRDELGTLYRDSEFAPLFAARGRPAESPGRLAFALVIQHAEGLTDRQVAEAIRGRIDLKYALGLDLTDPGFDYSVLSEFRDRILAGGMECRLLDDMLKQFQERGWLKARGKQRTDSTHVLAAIRQLNRLECVGETMRNALNALATVAPEWLRVQVTADWFDLYGPRFEQYRLPNEKTERQALGERIGADGFHLLSAIYALDAPEWLREVPAVQILRQVWIQQYYLQDERVHWRTKKEQGLPANSLLIVSPYDVQARNRTKRNLNWTGYAAHLTEICDPDAPHLITHVETTVATTAEVRMTETIHTALADKDLLPSEHFVDTAYTAAENLVSSRTQHAMDLVGPVQLDSSWQARTEDGYDIACFVIDWERQIVTCPQGRISQNWRVRQRGTDKGCIEVRFNPMDCASCPARSRCTKSVRSPRVLTLRPQAQHEALQAARQRQTTAEFKQRYKVRAGVEGTISQATRSFDLRRSRYVGLEKTHLHHVLVAIAMNLARVFAWLEGVPFAETRSSRFAALAAV
jgi:transposase